MLNAVVLCVPDRLIQAARPRSGRDHVPQAEPAIGQPFKPFVVGQSLQILVNGASEQTPELVRRMRVIAAGSQGRVAGQAAKNEKARVRSRDGR